MKIARNVIMGKVRFSVLFLIVVLVLILLRQSSGGSSRMRCPPTCYVIGDHISPVEVVQSLSQVLYSILGKNLAFLGK